MLKTSNLLAAVATKPVQYLYVKSNNNTRKKRSSQEISHTIKYIIAISHDRLESGRAVAGFQVLLIHGNYGRFTIRNPDKIICQE